MKDDRIYLTHVIEACDKIQKYTVGISVEEFIGNDMMFDATTREIMIIGEAVTNISDDFKNEHLDIPWHKMIGMRNRLIHAYFGVDPEMVWETVRIDVPELRAFVAIVLKK
ncbi:MAG: DUF86 domain-containing protein [Candidatus Andersenbacteria bacterium]